MPYERNEGPLYTQKLASDVLEETRNPFISHTVESTNDGFVAKVEHNSSGLEPLWTRGEVKRTNGESDNELQLLALSKATGLPLQEVVLFDHPYAIDNTTHVSLVDKEGERWLGKGELFSDAVLEVLAAKSVLR